MRRETPAVGSYCHVFNRGTRHLNIVRDDADRWRFLKLVRYLNDDNAPRNWERDIGPDHIRNGFTRPKHWPAADPYVSVLAYCLLDNHFHFLLRENTEGGISKFMHRLGTSMSKYFNEKYGEEGTLFEGPYQLRIVESDRQLQYVRAYIHIINPLQMYPGGLARAAREFERAFAWAQQYAFGGLLQTPAGRSALLDSDACDEILIPERQFKRFAEDVLLGRNIPIDWEWVILDK